MARVVLLLLSLQLLLPAAVQGASAELFRLMRELEVELEKGEYVLDTASDTVTPVTPQDPGETVLQQHNLQKRPVKIAAFNIQIFGATKYSKTDVMDVIMKVSGRKGGAS